MVSLECLPSEASHVPDEEHYAFTFSNEVATEGVRRGAWKGGSPRLYSQLRARGIQRLISLFGFVYCSLPAEYHWFN